LKLKATNSLETPEITARMTQCHMPERGDFKNKNPSVICKKKNKKEACWEINAIEKKRNIRR